MKSRTIFILLTVVLILVFTIPVAGDSIRMPGKMAELVHFITYNYSVTGEDLLFHLNEILLFEEMPTYLQVEAYVARGIKKDYLKARMRKYIVPELRRARRMTFSHRIGEIFQQDQIIRDYVISQAGKADGELSFDLNTRDGQMGAANLLLRLGLQLAIGQNGNFRVLEYHPANFQVNQYYKLQGYHEWSLERQLNKTRNFTFKLRHTNLPIPFELEFLSSATGLMLTRNNFAHQLVFDRRLQMFMGILFRLSREEIEFISGLGPDKEFWQQIYSDDHLLSGMFLLSHALRVKDGRLRLPGNSVSFWQQLTGAHPMDNPRLFLRTLAAKDGGKLNYFYVMGYFLQKDVQKEIFGGFNVPAFNEIYNPVRLKKKERTGKGQKIPQLDDYSVFSLFYGLQARGGKIYFPGGLENWASAIGAKEKNFRGILRHILSGRKRKAAVRRFSGIYTKFLDRPHLLTPQVLNALFQRFDDYNVIVDFIELLPIKKPGTVIKLLNWAASFETVPGVDPMNERNRSLEKLKNRLTDNQGKRALSVAAFQSLLAILSRGAGYFPGQYDYDRLLDALVAIPIHVEGQTYDGIIQFLDKQCGLDVDRLEADNSMTNFLLNGIRNPVVNLHDQPYTLDATTLMKLELKKIMEKQETSKFSQLARVNELLEMFGPKHRTGAALSRSLLKACEALPLTDTEESLLSGLVGRLIKQKEKNAHPSKIESTIRSIKDQVLLRLLKHFLVTGVYAIHTGSSNLRVYYNPNFSRLHDFTYHNGITPWNTCAKSLGDLREIIYHVEGGLSRLHIVLAEPFGEQLFRLKMEEYSNQTAPIIYNNLDLFPLNRVGKGQEYVGKLVQLGMDALDEVNRRPSGTAALKDRFASISAGYHYRKIMEKLDGKQPKYYPAFNVLLRLGKRVQMEKDPDGYTMMKPHLHSLGPVCYKTFGRLTPYYYNMFPQAVSQLFAGGITGGEMNNEFKVKAAYVSWKRGGPPELLGFLAFRYLGYASLYYSQKYENDFYKTYYMYDVYNHLYLDRMVKSLKHIGVLKIK